MTDMESSDDVLPADYHTLLADDHRREVLSHFQTASDDVTSRRELAKELSGQDSLDTEQWAVRLHHSILPRLAEADVLGYQSGHVWFYGDDVLEANLADVDS